MAVQFLRITIFILFSPIIYCVFASDEPKKSKVYTAETFTKEIDKTASFVKFYAPWCSHCIKLAPIWEELAEMLNDDEGSRVIIAEVDCTANSALCNEQDITGYPTLKFFKKGETEGIKYKGPRDFPSFSNFINNNLIEDDDEDPEEPLREVKELLRIRLSKGNFFVLFFAPWCGHSQKLAPIWEDLVKYYEGDRSITVEKVDCTVHKELCDYYDIRAYPTLYWLRNGRKIEKYEGHKNIDDFKSFVNDMKRKKYDRSQVDHNLRGTEYPHMAPDVVMSLTGKTFYEEIGKGGITFVKFYAPWCGHSQMFAPMWEELGKSLENSRVRIAKVDCSVERELCKQQKVEGYPTLLLYKGDSKEPIEYEGHRHKEFLNEFLALHSHDEL